jgi:hypothetical protein
MDCRLEPLDKFNGIPSIAHNVDRLELVLVSTLGHRLLLSLGHHATIATAAARGSPPAGMSSGDPSATEHRGRLAPHLGWWSLFRFTSVVS